MVKRPAKQEMNPAELRALVILIFIVSLLAENCNFDTLRKENSGALIPTNSMTAHLTGYSLALTPELNSVSQVILFFFNDHLMLFTHF
jgi:hypothetical protein